MDTKTKLMLVAIVVMSSTFATGCLGFGLGCGPIRAALGFC